MSNRWHTSGWIDEANLKYWLTRHYSIEVLVSGMHNISKLWFAAVYNNLKCLLKLCPLKVQSSSTLSSVWHLLDVPRVIILDPKKVCCEWSSLLALKKNSFKENRGNVQNIFLGQILCWNFTQNFPFHWERLL